MSPSPCSLPLSLASKNGSNVFLPPEANSFSLAKALDEQIVCVLAIILESFAGVRLVLRLRNPPVGQMSLHDDASAITAIKRAIERRLRVRGDTTDLLPEVQFARRDESATLATEASGGVRRGAGGGTNGARDAPVSGDDGAQGDPGDCYGMDGAVYATTTIAAATAPKPSSVAAAASVPGGRRGGHSLSLVQCQPELLPRPQARVDALSSRPCDDLGALSADAAGVDRLGSSLQRWMAGMRLSRSVGKTVLVATYCRSDSGGAGGAEGLSSSPAVGEKRTRRTEEEAICASGCSGLGMKGYPPPVVDGIELYECAWVESLAAPDRRLHWETINGTAVPVDGAATC